MSFLIKVLLLAILVSTFPARAQEMEVGRGVVCDESTQAEQAALTSTVVKGCGILVVTYIQGAEIGRTQFKGRFVKIVEVVVVAVYDGDWQRITPLIQYILLPLEGEREA